MTWLVWRQHRKQLLFGVAAIAVLGAFFLITGLRMHEEYNEAGLGDCLPGFIEKSMTNASPHVTAPDAPPLKSTADGRCAAAASDFFGRNQMVILAGLLLGLLPMLAGMFWGATLIAREVEQGTHRLVWTQGVTHLRWSVSKITLVMAGVLALTAVYAVMAAWWLMPVIVTSGQRFDYVFFDQHGIVVFGYTIFAIALGIYAGTVTRRTPSAMAMTLVGFVGLRLLVMAGLRERLLATETRPAIVDGMFANPLHGDWILERLEGPSTGCQEAGPCQPGTEIFHPASHFWPIQGIETAIFVAVATVLLVLAVRRITRVLS
jgi:hypothetical protein